MMNVPVSILIIFALCCFLAVLLPWLKQKDTLQMSWAPPVSLFKSFLVGMIPLVLVLIVMSWIAPPVDSTWIGSLFLGYGIIAGTAQFKISESLKTVLFTLLMVISTVWLQLSSLYLFLGTLSGLLVYGVLNALAAPGNSEASVDYNSNDDWTVGLPGLVWLVGFYYFQPRQSASPIPAEAELGFLLGLIGLSLLYRGVKGLNLPIVQNPWLWAVFVTLVGGVSGEIFIYQCLQNPEKLKYWPCISGGGALFAVALSSFMGAIQPHSETRTHVKSQDNSDPSHTVLTKNILWLMGVGLATLVATRIYGTYGLLFLCATGLLCTEKCNVMNLAIFFWLSRVLLQNYNDLFDMNVSGVNLLHQYVSASVFAGVALPLVLSEFLKSSDLKIMKVIWILLGLCLFVPLATSYFLHIEAQSSFLISFVIASLVISVFQQNNPWGGISQHLPVLSCIMCGVSFLGSGLIEMGDLANREEQGMALLVTLVFLAAYGLLIWKLFCPSKSLSPEAFRS
ncbi:MAG: hypothetical protein K2X66_18380 [Cyanobacteria bacterium]|nr:hypothetical protein [Cyanobacteriota bacterium]